MQTKNKHPSQSLANNKRQVLHRALREGKKHKILKNRRYSTELDREKNREEERKTGKNTAQKVQQKEKKPYRGKKSYPPKAEKNSANQAENKQTKANANSKFPLRLSSTRIRKLLQPIIWSTTSIMGHQSMYNPSSPP